MRRRVSRRPMIGRRPPPERESILEGWRCRASRHRNGRRSRLLVGRCRRLVGLLRVCRLPDTRVDIGVAGTRIAGSRVVDTRVVDTRVLVLGLLVSVRGLLVDRRRRVGLDLRTVVRDVVECRIGAIDQRDRPARLRRVGEGRAHHGQRRHTGTARGLAGAPVFANQVRPNTGKPRVARILLLPVANGNLQMVEIAANRRIEHGAGIKRVIVVEPIADLDNTLLIGTEVFVGRSRTRRNVGSRNLRRNHKQDRECEKHFAHCTLLKGNQPHNCGHTRIVGEYKPAPTR